MLVFVLWTRCIASARGMNPTSQYAAARTNRSQSL